ncbi:MAG: lipoyl domain-containing protein, partial [Candidatus Flexifilum sp.]
MSQPLIMPDLGSGMEEGTLLGWTKQIGDAVSAGDVIAEIDADKATVEVPATASGVITQFLFEPGAVLKVGQPIAYIEPSGAAAASAPTPTAAPAAAPAAAATPVSAAAPAVEEDGNLPGGVRATPIARRMVERTQQIPHFYVTPAVDVEAL